MGIKKFKVGQVQDKKDKSGKTVKMGTETNPNVRFRNSVEVIVRDADGKEVARAVNPFFVVENPRKRTNKDGSGLTEDQLAKIPAWITSELFLVVSDE